MTPRGIGEHASQCKQRRMRRYKLVSFLFVLMLLRAGAPPYVTVMNPNYVGPALGSTGFFPYQGKDHVFHFGKRNYLLVLLHIAYFIGSYASAQ
jgi:hypothetical protein